MISPFDDLLKYQVKARDTHTGQCVFYSVEVASCTPSTAPLSRRWNFFFILMKAFFSARSLYVRLYVLLRPFVFRRERLSTHKPRPRATQQNS